MLEAALVAAPAAAVGCAAGALATYGPSARLLTLLNEPPPGCGAGAAAAGGWLAGGRDPGRGRRVAGLARRGRRPVVSLLRGADVSRRPARRRRRPGDRASAAGLASARRAARRRPPRAPAGDRHDPRPVGRVRAAAAGAGLRAEHAGDRSERARQALPADRRAAAARRRRGPADPRRAGRGAALRGPGGRLVLARRDDRRDRLPGRPHAVRGAAAGQRPPACAARGQTEIGEGLAQALGLGPGQTLAIELGTGIELRLRVAGVVSSLDHDGRVAYVPAAALLAADPSAPSLIAVAPDPGRRRRRRSARALRRLGVAPATADRRDRPRRSAGVDPAHDPPRDRDRRRSRLPVRADPGVRADRPGAPAHDRGPACLRRRRAGGRATAARRRARAGRPGRDRRGRCSSDWCSGPALSHLAANYATLPLHAGAGEIALTVAGLLLAGGAGGGVGRLPGAARFGARGIGVTGRRCLPRDGPRRRLTRRRAIAEAAAGAGALAAVLAGCGVGRRARPRAVGIDARQHLV